MVYWPGGRLMNSKRPSAASGMVRESRTVAEPMVTHAFGDGLAVADEDRALHTQARLDEEVGRL